MLKRLNIYFKEMYPIIPRLLLGIMVFLEIYFIVLCNSGITDFNIGISEIVCGFTIFSFLAWLRIADDFKDYEHLNLEPGKKVTKFLADYLHDPDGDWFNDSLSDRFEDGKIYGVYFDNTFLSDRGSFDRLELAEGRVTEVSVEISPISVSGEHADIRISDGVSGEEEGEWSAGDEE
jgi:hypothetical protein